MIKVFAGAAALAASAAAMAQGGVAIVNVGSEQAVRVGETVVTRPFGAQLVDRLAIEGRYRGGDAQLFVIRGDSDARCPARYVVLAQRGRDVAVSQPFGTCSAAARVSPERGGLLITMPATALGGPRVRFSYRDGGVTLLDGARAASISGGADDALGMGARAPASCRTAAETDPATQAAVLADFEHSFPREYASYGGLHRAEIDPPAMRALVTGLACLYTWPGAERVVARRATPLFTSGRWGHAAFAAVEAVARDPQTDGNLGAALKSFGAEMHYRAERHDPLWW